MYQDDDERAQAMERVNDTVESIIKQIYNEPCQPIPYFTNKEEVEALVEKRKLIDMKMFFDEAMTRSKADELMKHRYIQNIGENFRKFVCSCDLVSFSILVSQTNEEFSKYTELADVRTKLTF